MKRRELNAAATRSIAAAIAVLSIATSAEAALPVIDASNLSQTTVSALQSISQTLKQIEQYRLQLQQYQNMLTNTAVPASHTWDDAIRTMSQLRASLDTLQYYKTSLGSVDNYLKKFKDTATYRSSPCFNGGRCSREDWASLNASQDLGSESQKRANDALMIALDRQQQAMEDDAHQLQLLQSSAQGASGQMQALGYANQLASHQSNQLLQIRALLIAQQNLIATRYQAEANRDALARASDAAVLRSTVRPSASKGW